MSLPSVPPAHPTVEEICESINARHNRGKSFSIVVVAEGAQLAFASGEKRLIRASPETDMYGYPRLGGIGQALGKEVEARTGFETRSVVLGHIQRGGTPSAFDRVLATRYGLDAMLDRMELVFRRALADNASSARVAEQPEATR